MKMARFVSALFVVALFLGACGGDAGGGVTLGKKIAFLLPDSQAARYERKDLPFFQAKLKSMCSDCTIDYRNAHGDAAAQLAQAKAALGDGANVLVLDPVDATAASAIVAQANGLLTALKGKTNPTVVMINGDPADGVARLVKLAAQDILKGKVNVAKTYDTPPAGPGTAQTEMADALAALKNKVDAVYAVDDATAGGAVAALTAGGVKPLPPVTGAGADLTAVQRILTGKQYMTVYKPIRAEAESAAQLAYDLAYGVVVPSTMTNGNVVDNGSAMVPALLVSPVAVTRQTVISTIVADGFWTKSDLCTDQYLAACSAAGI